MNKKEKVVKFVFDREKSLLPYNNNWDQLKNYITDNFTDDLLIDFEQVQRQNDMKFKVMTLAERIIEQKIDNQRLWAFLTNTVMLREAGVVNSSVKKF